MAPNRDIFCNKICNIHVYNPFGNHEPVTITFELSLSICMILVFYLSFIVLDIVNETCEVTIFAIENRPSQVCCVGVFIYN